MDCRELSLACPVRRLLTSESAQILRNLAYLRSHCLRFGNGRTS
jgi:hypothetical protein